MLMSIWTLWMPRENLMCGNTVITMNAHTRLWDMKYMGKPIVVEMRT
jgi:hypothetical protein